MTTMYECIDSIFTKPACGLAKTLTPKMIKLKPAQEISITRVLTTKIKSIFFIVSMPPIFTIDLLIENSFPLLSLIGLEYYLRKSI